MIIWMRKGGKCFTTGLLWVINGYVALIRFQPDLSDLELRGQGGVQLSHFWECMQANIQPGKGRLGEEQGTVKY